MPWKNKRYSELNQKQFLPFCSALLIVQVEIFYLDEESYSIYVIWLDMLDKVYKNILELNTRQWTSLRVLSTHT